MLSKHLLHENNLTRSKEKNVNYDIYQINNEKIKYTLHWYLLIKIKANRMEPTQIW